MGLFELYGIKSREHRSFIIKIYAIMVLVVFFMTIGIIISNKIEMKRKYENISFCGTISKMTKGDDGNTRIFSGEDKIIFYYYHSRICKFLHVGDSIVKNRGEMSVVIYKNKYDLKTSEKIILNPEIMSVTTSPLNSSE